MGFFSLKATCSICNRECGLNRYQIKDKKWVCPQCLKKAELIIKSPLTLISMSSQEIANNISQREKNIEKLSAFQTTKAIGDYLKIDEIREEWYLPEGPFKYPNVYSYEDVIDFELIEDGETISQGGLGSAVVGEMLFGDVGGFVGAVTGKKTKKVCTSLKIKITLNDVVTPSKYIILINTATNKSSIVYQKFEKQAQEIMSLFQIMCNRKKSGQQTQQCSSADEIKKYKELLDEGAITKEEFDAKKKQLLGL